MAARLKTAWRLLKDTAKAWQAHRASRLGAALAFYTVFSLAPLFIIVLAIAGLWFGELEAREKLFREVHGLVGEQGGTAIEEVIAAADRPRSGCNIYRGRQLGARSIRCCRAIRP